MKFRIEKNEFQKHISTVANIVPQKPVVSVISNVMIEALKNKIMISATDFEITMHSEINLKTEEEGSVVVNARILTELIKRLPDGFLDINIDNNEMIIKCGTGVYKIPTIPKDQYVDVVRVDKSKLFIIESIPIVNAIENTTFAASRDAIKIAITGILLEASGKSLSFIATDGHRLAVYIIKDIFEKSQSISVIIPPKALNILKGLIVEKESFEIGFDEKRIMFKIDETEFSAKLIEGTYPDYKRVIPNDNDKTLLVSKDDLIDSLNRVSLFANTSTKLVSLEIHNNKININAFQSQTGEGTESISAEYAEKEPIIIGFNNASIIEIIKKIETKKAKMKLKSEMSAVIITNEEDKIGEESTYLIMPLRLK